jgi:phosphoribosylanthranilate isomerase
VPFRESSAILNDVKIKICGVTTKEDAARASSLGAWAVGLIFAEKSPRVLAIEEAKDARQGIVHALAIGVFQDQPEDFVLQAVETAGLDAVQLHGNESPEFCAAMPVPVYKAFQLDGETPDPSPYKVAGVLLETKAKAWPLAAELARGRKALLAGALTPENVAEAAQMVKPFAVDVSSGVESRPRVKDPKKLEAFFDACRRLP